MPQDPAAKLESLKAQKVDIENQITLLEAEIGDSVAVKPVRVKYVEAKEVKPEAPGPTLGKLILERLTELKNPPSQVAIDFLKQEVKKLFL